MLCRSRYHLLLLILAGAVVDGGSLGFRAAWASCGDWLADPMFAHQVRPDTTIDQVSSELNRRFEHLYLREDERVEGVLTPVLPRRHCDCTDPSCSMQPALPVTPQPVSMNWDMDRYALWLQLDRHRGDEGRAHLIELLHLTPLYRPTDIFRPPRVLY